MRHKSRMIWNMGRKLTNEENEKPTCQDMKYDKKQ